MLPCLMTQHVICLRPLSSFLLCSADVVAARKLWSWAKEANDAGEAPLLCSTGRLHCRFARCALPCNRACAHCPATARVPSAELACSKRHACSQLG